jgi:hypothetical protein
LSVELVLVADYRVSVDLNHALGVAVVGDDIAATKVSFVFDTD